MIKLYGYSKCSTVSKAKKFLDSNNIKYEYLDNVQNKLTKKELEQIYKKANVYHKKLFNTSGNLYKQLNLKDKVDKLSSDEALDLLTTDGMLVKRPLLVLDDQVLIGFKVDKWEEALLN